MPRFLESADGNFTNEFGPVQNVDLHNGYEALSASAHETQRDPAIAYTVVEYDDARFMVFFALGSTDQPEELQALTQATAATLTIGTEVSPEKVTAASVTSIDLEANVRPLNITHDRIYASEGCNRCEPGALVILSLDGTELSRIENVQAQSFQQLQSAEGSNLWTVKWDDNFSKSIQMVSAEGEELFSIDTEQSELSDVIDVQVGQDGYLYVLGTREIIPAATQAPHEVRRNYTQVWMQVWNDEGALQREFLVKYDEYSLMPHSGGMVLGPEGNLYVLDTQSNGIIIFDSHGNLLEQQFARGSVMFQSIYDFIVMPDSTILFVTETGEFENPQHTMSHLDASGHLLSLTPIHELGLSASFTPIQLSLTASGDIIMLGYDEHETKIFRVSLNFGSTSTG